MIRNAIQRAITSFAGAIAINIIIGCILIAEVNKPDFLPVLPEFAARFSTPVMGMLIQWLLIGVTSAAFGFWSILFEKASWSMLLQSILYFVLTSIVWIPVAVVCWGLGTYVSSFISVILSYSISYIVVWVVQFRKCKLAVKQINQRLQELSQ